MSRVIVWSLVELRPSFRSKSTYNIRYVIQYFNINHLLFSILSPEAFVRVDHSDLKEKILDGYTSERSNVLVVLTAI